MGRFLKSLSFLAGAVGAGALVYGTLVESNRIQIDRHDLELPDFPPELDGYKVAVLADLHLRDVYTETLARRAVALAFVEEPDAFVFPGDIVAYWKPETLDMARRVLEPLAGKNVILTTGNHESWAGSEFPLVELCRSLGFKFLLNEAYHDGRVTWVGISSAKVKGARPEEAFASAAGLEGPRIVVWHEPDVVDLVPEDASLMISGHSHGGQFRFPGGFTPMHTAMGEKYPRGFYPDTRVPLYVSRGLGTTGPPSRFLCPPELSILTLNAMGSSVN